MVEQLQTGLSQRKRPSNPFEKGDAEVFFQRGDLPAERRLRLAQRTGGRGQRTLLSGGEEGPRSIPLKGDGLPIHAYPHITSTNFRNSYLISAWLGVSRKEPSPIDRAGATRIT